MVEKRRGLGRGLGALIPSAPPEEENASAPDALPPTRGVAGESSATAAVGAKNTGRPADLFFETVTKEDVAEQPRSYSSALTSGISKSRMEAQTKRVAKTTSRKSPTAAPEKSGPAKRQESDGAVGQKADNAPVGDATGNSVASARPRHIQAENSASQESSGHIGETKPDTEMSASAVGEEVPTSSGSSTHPHVSRETADDRRADIQDEPRDTGRELIDVPGATFADIRLDDIHPNRKQPRTEFDEDELSELVHSIREIGVLQPIVVRPSQEGGSAAYELVMGERRWRASQEAGKDTVPAIIRSTLDDDLLRDALLENLHRSALNPLEEAAAYQQLLDDFGCSHDELAGRLGRSRPQISNTLRLMKLPPLVQRRLAAGVLSAGHARALLGLSDAAEMEGLAQRIVAEGLSVRSTEEIVALNGGLRRAVKPSVPGNGARHERLDYLASSLSDRLDTNVKITLGAKKGRVSIEFASVDDLNRIVGVLAPAEDG